MLARTLLHFLSEKHPAAVSWFETYLGADYVACLGSSSGSIQIEARKEDRVRHLEFDAQALMDALESKESAAQLEAVALAWSVCKFHDLQDETDAMLRDFVKTNTGLSVEPIPFFRNAHGLVLKCDRAYCSGSSKKSKKVVVSEDGDVISIGLRFDNPAVGELLLGRLRRISV